MTVTESDGLLQTAYNWESSAKNKNSRSYIANISSNGVVYRVNNIGLKKEP